jgi:hypothetical protein
MGKNLDLMVEKKIIDTDAAKALHPEVIAKIEKFTDEEIKTIIKFKLEISGTSRWAPEQDGSIF